MLSRSDPHGVSPDAPAQRSQAGTWTQTLSSRSLFLAPRDEKFKLKLFTTAPVFGGRRSHAVPGRQLVSRSSSHYRRLMQCKLRRSAVSRVWLKAHFRRAELHESQTAPGYALQNGDSCNSSLRTNVLSRCARRVLSLCLLAAITLHAASARSEPELNNTRYLRDHAETRGFMLGRPAKAVPTPDGKAVLFLRAQARVPKLQLYEFDVATGRARELVTPEQVLKGAEEKLSPEEKARRERMRVSVGGFTDFQLSKDGRRILISLSGKPYLVERATGEVRELITGAGTLVDPKLSPDGESLAYVLDHDVYAFDLGTQTERRVTFGGTDKLRHGIAEFVAQEEMDRFSGYWWSPDSRLIAYEESDYEGVEVWHVADAARPDVSPFASYYPRPGKNNARVRLGVVPVGGGDTVWISWDRERYPYLTSVRWDKHGPLTLGVQTRDQHELVLLEADTSGRTTALLTERDAEWVSVRQDVPRWLADGRGFV